MPLQELPVWYRSTWFLALASSVLAWISLPPADLWPLAWLAPVGWLVLVRGETLAGRRPYALLWLAGFLFWLGALHWLRLPHWATCIGWVALSFYLAFYLPVFVALARVAVHRLRIPVILAAPAVWVGLELVQAYMLTGFRMASLGHSQYRWITLIQISDLAGDYAVDFLVLFVAACLARMLPCDRRPGTWRPLAAVAAALALVLGYGAYRTSGDYTRPAARVALIQGQIDTEFNQNLTQRQQAEKLDSAFGQYMTLSHKARHEESKLDLILWPESMYPWTLVTYEGKPSVPAEWSQSADEFHQALETSARETMERMSRVVRMFNVPTVLGVDHEHYAPDGRYRYNEALLFGADGTPLARYDKMHPVVFGEYMPFGKILPWLQRLTPVSMNLDAGPKAEAFCVRGVCYAPSICFETVLSRIIRRQIHELKRAGREPDVLVNLTNDGWFWGSSELELHLMCGVFRAVECRKPLLIAANAGRSASIDGDGRIRAIGPRRATAAVVVDVALDQRTSPYLIYGDVPAGVCLAFCAMLAVVGMATRIGRRAAPVQSPPPKQVGHRV